ncbi:MAG: hypothetical protein COV74_05505 [Candidatus Omnitrophica bacterium CG11_big_fil_rev_8_21_14_0_20_45_26]|uniref:Prolyl 4-hydroxylase alpha subunit Fe(2+) 2OG dioxygenase domain-containing protein n=1 Tax=Candidatus Abzuiibacterium crystallinum TaxID=1974748 RepID=A0A2H0LPG9_9BACT|nr:MAG: hypothetical protein COV74_05505 [Candidatus Omnitrophica bacterium CG11_big_fil_rev_8_21_14_0_20_45_26]PIW64347.1 MAG: hypothetical protein COW12_06825 [Candidatus Omnitrophica bacterium CG12_big_fil_rev_8_21_14_0_65_45_16]
MSEKGLHVSIPAFYFDREKLLQLARDNHNTFTHANPFPHIVFDNFIPVELISLLADEFPRVEEGKWTFWGPGDTIQTKRQFEKFGTSDETQFGPFTRHFMMQLNSDTFLRFLQILAGIEHLIPDPSFNRCGMHSTGMGGKLMIHTDQNRYPIEGRFHQILNAIFFINPDWREDYGGHLELWNKDLSKCEASILPIANRLVIFETGRFSFHGHPNPVTCPPHRRRNSLAVYYYMWDRPEDGRYQGYQEGVNWYAVRPEEKLVGKWIKLKRIIKKFVPPILMQVYDKIIGKK